MQSKTIAVEFHCDTFIEVEQTMRVMNCLAKEWGLAPACVLLLQQGVKPEYLYLPFCGYPNSFSCGWSVEDLEKVHAETFASSLSITFPNPSPING